VKYDEHCIIDGYVFDLEFVVMVNLLLDAQARHQQTNSKLYICEEKLSLVQ
jgi:hypothetical protein